MCTVVQTQVFFFVFWQGASRSIAHKESPPEESSQIMFEMWGSVLEVQVATQVVKKNTRF